jgi:hypothetical protein
VYFKDASTPAYARIVKMRKWQIRTEMTFTEMDFDTKINVGTPGAPVYPYLISQRYTPEKQSWDAQIEGFVYRDTDETLNLGANWNGPLINLMKLSGVAIKRWSGSSLQSTDVLTQDDFYGMNNLDDSTHTVQNRIYARFDLDPAHWYEGDVFIQNMEIIAEFPKSVLISITLRGSGVLEYNIDLD